MDCASLFRYAENCYYKSMNRSFVKKFNVTTALSVVVFFVLCAVAFVFVSCASRLSAEESDALESLSAVESSSLEGADILFYAENLIKNHVGISKLVSLSEFCEDAVSAAKRLDEAEAAGKSDSERLVEEYYELCKLAAMLHDGHTSVQMPQEIVGDLQAYPFNANVIGGKLIVSAVPVDCQDCTGMEIVGAEIAGINGKSAEEVISALKTIVSYDTEAYAMANVASLINMRNALDFTGLGTDDGILQLEFADGSEISFAPLSLQEMNNLEYCTLVTNVERTLYPSSYYECYDLSDDTLFVQYNACMNADGYSVADFSNDVLGFIDNNGFSRIIVDLRFNGGGNSMLFDPFIKELGKRISSGQCKGFVLISTNTFSSAVLNAWNLKKAGCVLVGTPTGGAINHYGEVRTFDLPESGILVSYSTKHFIQDKNAAPGSIMPDVLVDFSVEDLRNGHDSQVAVCMDK